MLKCLLKEAKGCYIGGVIGTRRIGCLGGVLGGGDVGRVIVLGRYKIKGV